MRTKQEVINFLESKVGTKVPCVGNPSLDGQCVTLIKSLMEFLGVPNPYKARGHAKSCISAYLSEGIAKQGTGFLSVFSNKDMAGSYGHIWCNAGEGNGVYYESNGQKPLIVTKGKTYSYDMVCNFDQYITNDTEGQNTQKTYTQAEWQQERDERNKNWDLYQSQLKENEILKSTIQVKDEKIKSLEEKHQSLVEFIIAKISPLVSFVDNSEEAAKQAILDVISKQDVLAKEIKDTKEAAEKKERELVKANEDLLIKLETVQAKFDKMVRQHTDDIESMQENIDKLQKQIDIKKQKEAQNDAIKKFITSIINKLKG